MARVTIATDNFNRAALGSNWQQLNPIQGNIAIQASTLIVAPNANPDDARQAARFNGTTSPGTGQVINESGVFTDDQYAKVKIALLQEFDADYSGGVIVRASADQDAARDYYAAVVLADSAGPTYTTILEKIVNGTRTQLHSAQVEWAVGDFIELEAEGTTLRVCKNGTPLGGSFTQTDASLTTGKPGYIGAGDETVGFQGDDWEGGNITASADADEELTGSASTSAGGTAVPGISIGL